MNSPSTQGTAEESVSVELRTMNGKRWILRNGNTCGQSNVEYDSMECQICSLFANAAITCRFFTSVSSATTHSFILRIWNAHAERALVGVCECRRVWNGKLVYFQLCDALADSFDSFKKNNRNLWSRSIVVRSMSNFFDRISWVWVAIQFPVIKRLKSKKICILCSFQSTCYHFSLSVHRIYRFQASKMRASGIIPNFVRQFCWRSPSQGVFKASRSLFRNISLFS